MFSWFYWSNPFWQVSQSFWWHILMKALGRAESNIMPRLEGQRWESHPGALAGSCTGRRFPRAAQDICHSRPRAREKWEGGRVNSDTLFLCLLLVTDPYQEAKDKSRWLRHHQPPPRRARKVQQYGVGPEGVRGERKAADAEDRHVTRND